MKSLILLLSIIGSYIFISTPIYAHTLGSCSYWDNQNNFEFKSSKTLDSRGYTAGYIPLKYWNQWEKKIVDIFAKSYGIEEFDEITYPTFTLYLDKSTNIFYVEIYFVGDDGDHFGLVTDVFGNIMVKFYGLDHYLYCSEDFQA